jgi:TATA-binding protein-associated factor
MARYRLHCILADDMGLGKTVQALCALSYARRHARAGGPTLSLIVCPASVVYHWVHESATRFTGMRALAYVGTPAERKALRATFSQHDVIVTSYEVLRGDVNALLRLQLLYCVLDEGHIVRNAGSKVAAAAKQLLADHRLILSGTPLQNDVVELWSLFDFLTPGYLGTEKEFRAAYGKPISAARDSKAKAHVREKGTLALEALHRQILPFIMRRTKESVLKDLPPKIIQDYMCSMSPLQALLYDGASVDSVEPETAPKHVFQKLQHLRKLLNHPASALAGGGEDENRKATAWLRQNGAPLNDAAHSGKLLALETLLTECGMGGDQGAAQHRALLFVQQTSSLDLIEQLVLRARMPNVTYLRLDGQVKLADRAAIVKRFNTDPTVDILMLTVKVGGLGLTLTGADTVIFFEHDWNPQVDAQAMDRAHRLGQMRTVNVYRLITRDTLEESIMSLQRFKMHMAKMVVNEENASMSTMDTGALMDLMEGGGSTNKEGGAGRVAPADDDGEDEEELRKLQALIDTELRQ